jgi:hypothetical protein
MKKNEKKPDATARRSTLLAMRLSEAQAYG